MIFLFNRLMNNSIGNSQIERRKIPDSRMTHFNKIPNRSELQANIQLKPEKQEIQIALNNK